MSTKALHSRRYFILGLSSTSLVLLLAACSHVSESEQLRAKSILNKKMPNFESQARTAIKNKNPKVIGRWRYKFSRDKNTNEILIQYGIHGINWLQFLISIIVSIITLGIFEPGYQTGSYVTVAVNLQTENVRFVSR
ncbi:MULTISPECIES: hypothetical protein [Arthrospira]|uniref:Lipoprotein n=2 Tax=Limnospira platensis TaxID=118562 RepID=A0A5M3TAH3_LIMPL|nr:hypothetical protein [Arthrospira platensis]AMW27341.1 hypothetical protein AP285_04415 [Arthrospira platensis YZ]KDR57688.1 hypothetical protein APPUASWS_009450 [Arthrospira platensis str. Paraca]MBD2668507.1 hypothetical protein [Arthrospira platensis FACHB-439]MBD2710705.1 hypothetical protein [Arthrospira platensis FACHB-835]MDT9181646.1 hypothetical protein [Limnospira sp. PMC 289.06]MDT9309068.1 hypothetical protein [Limnospira sp. Paracas R14]QQW30086.1 hypothetical protein AP9108_